MGYFHNLIFAVFAGFKEVQEKQTTVEPIGGHGESVVSQAEHEQFNKLQKKARKICECAETVLQGQRKTDGTSFNYCPKIGHECVYMENANDCWFGYDN